MTSMMTGGVFNAFAFAGAGFLFKSLDGNKYGDEMERHNKAMEKLAYERERWNEEEVAKRDKLAQLREDLSNANRNINDTNAALDQLNATLSRDSRREPRLGDYYTPSPKMKGYMSLTKNVMYLGVGWVGYKLVKKMT